MGIFTISEPFSNYFGGSYGDSYSFMKNELNNNTLTNISVDIGYAAS